MKCPYPRIVGAFLKALALSLALVATRTPSAAETTSAPQSRIEKIAMTPSGGAEYSIGNLHITAPWMRATPKGASVASGYMTITNMGSERDRLLSIESDIATTVEVHEMSQSGEVMKMRPLEKPLEIAPGGVVELKPSGYHLMFSHLKQGVNEGDKVRITMVFEKAGKIEIELAASGIAAKGPSGAPMMQDGKM
ncbi:MAG: copper chaperone PCu(A)C [Hyphomicrobiales bacterium]|nr:copper chaperone PCu(A)C [Hyphomicrobiales bacterium]